MKKNHLKTLAVVGILSGVMVVTQSLNGEATPKADENAKKERSPDDGNMGYHLMTEEELLLELTPEGIKLYNQLDEAGKTLAREVASMRCNASNQCAGLNACATDDHDCAGKGKCKGQGKCAFSDKNLAVKVVFDKMAEKRAKALK